MPVLHNCEDGPLDQTSRTSQTCCPLVSQTWWAVTGYSFLLSRVGFRILLNPDFWELPSCEFRLKETKIHLPFQYKSSCPQATHSKFPQSLLACSGFQLPMHPGHIDLNIYPFVTAVLKATYFISWTEDNTFSKKCVLFYWSMVN